jgi:hypothetical protein
VVANLRAKRLVDTVASTEPDELNGALSEAVEDGLGLGVRIMGLAGAVEGFVDGGGVVACWVDC